jgi:formylglycine-generating enzyme required for sulfatase activity
MSASAVWGQNAKEKVAIYTDDKSGRNYVDFAGDYITNAIVKRGVYDAFERTGDFLKLINQEQAYQRDGSVSEDEIAKLGAQLGVKLVCAVKIGTIDGSYFISAKLIDVETAGIKGTARPTIFTVGDLVGFEQACEKVTASLFGERGSGSSMQGNRSQSSNTQHHPAEPEMVSVQGGTFWMGCSSEQQGSCQSDESPLHSVTVGNFRIAKYEVTQAQWKLIMGTSVRQQLDKVNTSWPLRGEGNNYPMYSVSWHEAQEFISRLNAATGKQYRLPTEAEWEYAARGGNQSRGYKYSGSNFIEQVAWFDGNSGSNTHPVGTKRPNELGIYDMSGNVYEWCYDGYGTYPASAQRDPMGASSSSDRVGRGGGAGSSAADCRVADRNGGSPSNRGDQLGFRLVLSE